MAGESPDRSKQRESSAEPTSGSAGTVPEARESREIRDPRVAVARDSEPSPARGGVDTATRVFSVRDLKTEEAEEPGAAETDAEVSDTDASDASGTDASEAPGTGSAETEPTGEPEAEAEPEAEPEAAEETPEAASGDSGDAKDAGTAAAAEESADDGAGDAPEGDDGTGGVSGATGEAPEGGEDRLRAAVAQWVATADGKSPEDAPTADSAREEADEPADEPADATTDAVSDDAPDADADARSDDAPEVDVRAGSAAAKADERPGADDLDATDEPEDTRPENANESAAPAAAEDEAGSGAGPAAKRAPKWASDAGEPEKPGKTDAEPEDDGPEDAKADRSPVDQPTAVFKTRRPKPAVDQPTTMLKLGDVKPRPGGEKADAADASEATDTADTAGKSGKTDTAGKTDRSDEKPAAPAERTSKFVALKPLDEPRPPKPAAQTPADVTAFVPQVGPERTTQQPLPPKPPLDLLAELTNTPPPPPTPLRTLGRRLKIWTPLVLLLVVVFAIVQAVRPLPATALTLTAKSSYTFEGGRTQLPWPNEGQGWIDADGVGTMGAFGKQTPVAIGSVAKTMTAYIILKDHPMKAGEEGPEIEVDATAEKEGGYDVTLGESTLNTVKAGDKLTEKQALSAVIIPSANNIARLLARWDAGSVEAFVKKMNATAKELGMTNTTYTDPSGLKETTVSTAEDQVKLGRAFVEVPALVAISSAASWDDPSGKNWPNYNELPFRIGAIGIKTGSTSAAGGNLLFASRKKVDGKSVTLVGAILGQHKREILKTANVVSQAALLAAEDALTSAKILKKGDVVGYVDDKLGGHTPVVITQDVSAAGWAGLTVKLSFTSGEVPHTAKAGTQVGTLTVGDGSSSAVKVPVALQTDLAEPGFSDKLTRVG
ncbi:D-alanyl-D-alanine carboxypeptidase (penicillin-binding protein 5/6) [Streptomyces achromogenes]|uniref:serine-type D-Ala-D-Ala carboxypeptidase n=1 Tax=Streptomyces achromogenes TaxID=67255 RepID=A0ABU0Q1D9_STRAH|nr:D-alanyl-D-alanine carboxypeptidase [Streptomyces achromogenes]MDQ0684457.1 D-alanyl-D-alanine carboxypeptidase (penicillin-binding protein 5/6) [Streptomyces achromogenes]